MRALSRDLFNIVLSQKDFKVLAPMCAMDPEFPNDYETWLALTEQAEREAHQFHLRWEPLPLNPALFVTWCTRIGVVPCLDALRAFAIVQRGDLASRLQAMA